MKTQVVCLATALLSATVHAQNTKTLMKCKLGGQQKRTIEIASDRPIADSKRILLKESPGAPAQPIFGTEDDASRGADIEIKCIGGQERVLLVYGEFFGSGYPRGLAIRFNSGHLERITFAEPSLPDWVELGNSEMRIIFSTHGPDYPSGPITYRYVSGDGQVSEVQTGNLLPMKGSIRIAVK